MEIIPIFPKTLCICDIPDIFSSEYQKMKINYEFHNTSDENKQCSQSSKNVHVLNDFPNLRRCILDTFLDFKDKYFKYPNNQFEISTSWITKTEKHTQSEYHIHKNSYYSGVLYMDDVEFPEKTGKLDFMNVDTNPIYPDNPTEFNIFNCSSWSLTPRKNLLVFFPSNLYHKITYHELDSPRYSIAFNFFPINNIGVNDSHLNIKLLT